MVQGETEIRTGDAVELCQQPGEERTQVARIQAMWCDQRSDGSASMRARCRLYFRPEVGLRCSALRSNVEQTYSDNCPACQAIVS